MADILQLDDEASSVASFEDVGRESSNDLSAEKEFFIRDSRFKVMKPTTSRDVPDVNYVLRFRSRRGSVVECK